MKLDLYKGGASLCTIDASAPNTGSYVWTVDDCGGGFSSEYNVKITDTVDSGCYEYSDNFTINVP